MAVEGLITKASAHSFEDTLARLEAALKDKNMTLFAEEVIPRLRPKKKAAPKEARVMAGVK